MGHCIQLIITDSVVAYDLHIIHPKLLSVDTRRGFALFPVGQDFIDVVTGSRHSQASGALVLKTDIPWMLLTDAFHNFLRELSQVGSIAYIETEYFGGVGGQGAVVYSGREVLMEPEWEDFGPINRALKLIGVKRRLFGDRFSSLGLQRYRSNSTLVGAALALGSSQRIDDLAAENGQVR